MPKYLWKASYTTKGVRGVANEGGSSRRDARVVQPFAGRSRGFFQELLEPSGRNHLCPQVRLRAARVLELVAGVAGDRDRAILWNKVAPGSAELHPHRALEGLPVLLERWVEVLGKMTPVVQPGVDPQVFALSLERV